MDRLQTELQRLYGEPGETTRCLTLAFKARQWPQLAEWLQTWQSAGHPGPALSVDGEQGYRVWISLDEPVSREHAAQLLQALRQPPFTTDAAEAQASFPDPLPPYLTPAGKWSAFIDPTLGGLFAEEPGLEMAPSRDRQADLLSPLKQVAAATLIQESTAIAPEENPSAAGTAPCSSEPIPSEGPRYDHPKAFLLATMNDSRIDMQWRLEAAKALEAYFLPGDRA